eukprot:506351_1
MGASGVVMCDWKPENLFTMWMPPDWVDDISIPSVLLQKSNCATLMKHIGVQNWNPDRIHQTVYPPAEELNWTIATIQWGLPHDDDKVEWELWTSSNDYLGSQFKHNFNTTAIMLDKANDTIFTPHCYILNGSHWGCPLSDLPCKRQCSNSGRYCAVDPEYDLTIGLDGIDVIQENLRSLCVWEYDKQQRGVMDDVMWWDYAVLWDENCGVLMNTTDNFNSDCSFAQMDRLDATGAFKAYVQNCITDSGGSEYHGGVNTLLRRETRLKYNGSVYALPMIRVNEFLIHGNMDCVPPVTVADCEVLAAICAGFAQGTAPDVCSITPAPVVHYCNDTDKDCAGECEGRHQADACGACLLLSDPDWNACIGCNGQTNDTYDCAGTCGGHYAVNPCGYCRDTRIRNFATFGVDCNGTCSVQLKEDECGQCIYESDTQWNACVGCDNTPFSGFAFNPCGRCIHSSLADFDTFGKDCNGTCDGDHALDQCGACLATDSVDWNECIGCDGVPYSNKTLNECGWCIASDTPDLNDYGKDCRGVCPSGESAPWSLDQCGQCLSVDDEEFDNCCGGDANKNYNECGLCLLKDLVDFNARGKDCNGTCNGMYAVDACGACLLPTDAMFDGCIQCGESKNMTLDCNDVCGGNHAINPCGLCLNRNLDGFEREGLDCGGTCHGKKRIDACGQCLNTNSSSWDACVGCDGVTDSSMRINPCGVCRLTTATDFATYGKDCAGQCDGAHEMDECEQCLLPSDAAFDTCLGCDGVKYSNKTLNQCGKCELQSDADFDKYGRDCAGNCESLIEAETYHTDECGQCLLSNDESWNACVSSSSNNGSAAAAAGASNMIIMIIAGAAFVVIVCALIIIVYLCKKHRQMKRQFDEIQRTYRPMDDIPSAATNTRRSKIRVADNEADIN